MRTDPNFENPDTGDEEDEIRSFSVLQRSPADVERQVLSITMNSSVEELSAALDAADWLLSSARAIDRLKKQVAIDWIDHNGEFDIGDQHYSVGYSTTVKCLDVPQTAHTVLRASQGDLDVLFDLLIAQPFKHGSVRSVIAPPQYTALFKHQRTGRLVCGVPERALKSVNKKFLRNRA